VPQRRDDHDGCATGLPPPARFFAARSPVGNRRRAPPHAKGTVQSHPFNLIRRLRVARRAANVLDLPSSKPPGQVVGDVARPVAGQQPWPVTHAGLRAARRRQGEFGGVGDVARRHGGAELPGDDVAGEVVEHGGEVEPSPADHLQAGEAGLPELVRRGGLGVELLGRFDHDEGRAGDEVMGRQQAVDRGFGGEVALPVGEAHRQLARRQLGLGQRQVDEAIAHLLGDAVPDALGPRRPVLDRAPPDRRPGRGRTSGRTSPAGRPRGTPRWRRVRRTGRCDGSTRRMISSSSAAGYLIRARPHPRSCFFQQPQLERLLGPVEGSAFNPSERRLPGAAP
jgi:hypothetical protein